MIRVIVRTVNCANAAHVGGPIDTDYKTFDFDLPELEAFLKEPERKKWTYTTREVIGVELVNAAPAKRKSEDGK